MKMMIYVCTILSFWLSFGVSTGRLSYDTSHASSVDSKTCPPGFASCFSICCYLKYFYCDYISQTCKPFASDRILNLISYGSSNKGPSNSAETDVQNAIFDTSSVDSKADCPPDFIYCFAECCDKVYEYCDYLTQSCKPVASDRFLNSIAYGSSKKGPSYSSETLIQNDVSDTACLNTETQCTGSCCPYSNATCCTGTCCRQGSICLDSLNICLGIKPREETNNSNTSNPVLYTEKASKLRQVKSCPPFLIPCFDDCCAPKGMHCDSQRRTCVPNGEMTSGELHDFFLMIKMQEKTNSNPYLYTKKAMKLQEVKSCPPFWIPCADDCCPPIGMHCDSQRQACVPNDERTSGRMNHYLRMIQNT